MARFRKKPVVIEATQITAEWFDGDHPNPLHPIGLVFDPVRRVVEIPTLEGTMTGSEGDWIITGVKGERYPCKPDIFSATYEVASSPHRGVELIAAERERQKAVEGWTEAHDDEHRFGELAEAAVCYAMPDKLELPGDVWPFDQGWWKPTPKDRVRELVKAGALIAAEIDRLERKR